MFLSVFTFLVVVVLAIALGMYAWAAVPLGLVAAVLMHRLDVKYGG